MLNLPLDPKSLKSIRGTGGNDVSPWTSGMPHGGLGYPLNCIQIIELTIEQGNMGFHTPNLDVEVSWTARFMVGVSSILLIYSKEMQRNCEESGIRLKQAPIQTPVTIGQGERYHAPLSDAYVKL